MYVTVKDVMLSVQLLKEYHSRRNPYMRVGVFWRVVARKRVPRPSAVLPPFFSCTLSAAKNRRNVPVHNQTTVLPTKNELKSQ